MASSAIETLAEAGLEVREQASATKRARLRRPIYIAQAVSYAISTAILYLYYFVGTTQITTPIVYLAAGLAWVALCAMLSELRFNDRFADQYLIVPQAIGSITLQLCAIYLAPEIGIYFTCTIFIILGFGALRTSAGQAAVVWTFAAVGLTYLFAFTDKPIAIPMGTPLEREIALLSFLTLLGRCTSTGLYGSTLREMLYRRGKELKAAHAKIEQLAQIDELTGILNRRYIMKALSDEVSRAVRFDLPCSVAIIDLDFFKRINDTFGHPTGDQVLRGVAATLTTAKRDVDQLGRYGGEEFLLVLPGTTKNQAIYAIDRLRETVAALDWNDVGDNLAVTMSAGVSQVRADDLPEDVLARADAALYVAKGAGRNCVRSN